MQIALKHIKYPALLLLYCCLGISSGAQPLRLGIYSGYNSSSFDAFGPEYFRVADGRYSGFDIDYLPDRTFGFKLSYARQEARVTTPCYSSARNTLVERFELGFSARKEMEKKFEWITGIGFGICKLFRDTHEEDALKFASSFNAGLNYHISKFAGIQVQGRVLQFYSKTVESCSTNRVEPSSYGTVVTQCAITGGFLFSIGK